MLRNLLHFGENDGRRRRGAARRHHRRARRRSASTGLVAAFAEAGHSRLPVYEDSLDSVIGMIHIKDVFAVQVAGADAARTTSEA